MTQDLRNFKFYCKCQTKEKAKIAKKSISINEFQSIIVKDSNDYSIWVRSREPIFYTENNGIYEVKYAI